MGVSAPDPVADPLAAYAYLDARRDVIDEELRARPLIRLWDKHMRYIGTVAGEESLSAEELLHESGAADVPVRGDDWLVEFLRHDVRRDEDLHLTIDPYPHRRGWRWRWGGKVINAKAARAENGHRTVTFECIHHREHWKHLMLAATPFMPPEAQPIKAWLLPGNTRTIIATSGFINLARNYMPLLALPSNVLNPGGWIGEGSNLSNMNPLNWPVQMQFVNPATDQSRFSVIMSRWSDAHSVTEQMLRDAGSHVRAYTWLPEDDDSPHPELAALVGQPAARPTRACVVLAAEDKSGVTGPTGTAIDGLINLIAVSADNSIGEVLHNVDADDDGITDPWIRSLLKVAPEVPRVAFRDGEHSSIITSERNMFRAKAGTIVTGGKSPGWVNQMQTFLVRYALSQLASIIPLPGTAVQVYGSEGLDNIYQGQLDNMLLAFMRFTDPIRTYRSGPYGFLEHMEQGSGTAYTVSSALTLRTGHYKTRPYQAFKVAVRNGGSHSLFYDFDLGDRSLFEIDGILYTDQVSAWKLHYDESTPKSIDLSIGDDRELEDPVGAVTRSAQTMWNALGTLFGSGDLL